MVPVKRIGDRLIESSGHAERRPGDAKRARVRRDIGRTWRRHRLGVVAVLALVALVLGFIGYSESGQSAIDSIYSTLSLLAFNYTPPPGELNVAIQIARFMVPAVAAFATLSALVVVLGDQADLIRSRRRRGHVVICGLGRRGMRLVRSIRQGRRPRPVVVIEADTNNPNVKLARELGASVLKGNATDVEALEAARVDRADTLIAVLPDDADNAAVVSAAREVGRSGTAPLRAFAHVGDVDLVEELTSAAVGGADEGLVLEWFSVHERAARILLTENLDLDLARTATEPPRIGVVGCDDLARSIVVNAARQWRTLAGSGAGRIAIIVAWPDAGTWIEQLRHRYPSIEGAIELTAYETDIRSATALADAREAFASVATVFVCAPTDTESLDHAFAATRIIGAERTVVVRLLIEQGGFVDVFKFDPRSHALQLFSIVDRACSYEMVTAGLYEQIAQALHVVYLRQGTGSRAAVPWDRLDPRFRDSNRAQAYDITSKLNEIGCGVRPLIDWGADLVELSDAEIERLAALEHARWSASKRLQGYRAGVVTDDAAMPPTNEYIDVPWDQLVRNNPDVAELDREFARSLPDVVASAGYEIYRVRRSE